MYHQGSGLPVPADQPLAQNFVRQVPGYPQTPMSSGMPPQEVAEVHTALINALQGSVQKGPIRIFMFNLLSDQGFNNQMYADILDATLEYYMVLRQMQPQGNPVQIAVDETLKAEIPLLVERYRELMGYMTPQQQQELQGLSQLRNQISQRVRQAQGGGGGYGGPQPGGYGHPAPGYGHPNPNMGYGNPNMGYGNPNMGYGNPNMGMPMGGPPMGGPGGYPAHGGGHPGMRPGAHHAPMQSRPSATPMNPQARPNRSMLDNTNGRPAPTGASASRKPVVGASPVSTTPVFNEGSNDMKLVSQTDRELGHYSDLHDAVESESHGKYAPAIDRPVEFVGKRYVPARRPDQCIIKSEVDGEVTYTVIKVEDMNYADHEENVNMVKLSRDNQVGPKVGVPTDWTKVSMPSEVEPEDENLDLTANEPVMLKEFIDAYTLEQARVEAIRKLAGKGLSENSERVVECYVNMRTPVLSNREENKVFTDAVESAGDLTQLIDALAKIKDDVSPTLWYEVHDRMTCIFNRRLKTGLGLYDWNIDSITADYDEALEALAEEFRHAAIDRFKSNTYITMRKALISVFSDKTNILHLIDEVSITALPWSSDDIDLVLESEYAMLSASACDGFHTAAERLFKRTNVKELSVNRRYFVTADNVWIELHVGDLSGETLLISKVDRC